MEKFGYDADVLHEWENREPDIEDECASCRDGENYEPGETCDFYGDDGQWYSVNLCEDHQTMYLEDGYTLK